MSIVTHNIDFSDQPITHNIDFNYDSFSPSTPQQVESLLTDFGIWAKHDALHIRSGWTSAEITANEHLKNQIDNTYNTLVGSVTHSNTLGLKAVNTSSYIQWNFTGEGLNFVDGDFCSWVYFGQTDDRSGFEERGLLGHNNYYMTRGASSGNDYALGYSEGTPFSPTLTFTPGGNGLVAVGCDGTNRKFYNFGTYSEQSGSVTTSLSSPNFYELSIYGLGFFNPNNYDYVFASGVCSSLTETELIQLDTVLSRYFDNLNA